MMNASTKKIPIFFALCLVISSAFAVQKSRIIGGEQGWNDVARAEGVTTGVGRFGYECITLETNAHSVSASTDLHLTFDDNDIHDEAGHYTVVSNALTRIEDAVRGHGAAQSRGEQTGISLRGNTSALFGSKGMAGSFTIEFWLAPAVAENGETVLSWRSSRNTERYPQYQLITATFSHNHLEWNFSNVFAGYPGRDVTLAGITNVIPHRWARHTVSFDQETGLLEYRMDGRTEAVRFMTVSGHENDTVCEPVFGAVADLELCSDYTGKIDDVTIERRAYMSEGLALYATGNETYRVNGGRFTTHPILVSRPATLDAVDALLSVPAQTDVRLYVRAGDNCWDWTDSYPAWREVSVGERLNGVTGQYFQVAAELLPDGGGTVAPSITQIELRYTEVPLPAAPFSVRAEPGDGCVTLSWNYSVDDTAGGYYVYYGNRSGEYLGRVAAEGASPVRAGNVTSLTLTGLQNGTMYYFAVSSYSRSDDRVIGQLSQEVYARPSARK